MDLAGGTVNLRKPFQRLGGLKRVCKTIRGEKKNQKRPLTHPVPYHGGHVDDHVLQRGFAVAVAEAGVGAEVHEKLDGRVAVHDCGQM